MGSTKFYFDREDKKPHGKGLNDMESLGVKDIIALVAASFSVMVPFVMCCMIAVAAVFMIMRFLFL